MAQSKKQPNRKFMIYTEEAIEKEVKSIELKFKKGDFDHLDNKFIQNKIKEIKSFLSKANHPSTGFVFHTYANASLIILKEIIKNKSVDYNTKVLNTSTDRQIQVFIENIDDFSDEEYWRNLGYAYTMQNYKKIPYKTLYNLFNSDRPKRNKLMSKEELGYLKSLPKEITIFRGGSESEKKSKKYGVSWTLDRKIAEQFANVKTLRDKKKMIVHEMTIKKSEVIAYFNEREEEEIIYIHQK